MKDRNWTWACRVQHAHYMWRLSGKAQLWRDVLDRLGGLPKKQRYNSRPVEFEAAVEQRGRDAKAAFERMGGNSQKVAKLPARHRLTMTVKRQAA